MLNQQYRRHYLTLHHNSMAALSSSGECHVLPCKIDYSGKVSDFVYFHPHALEQMEENDDSKGTSQNDSDPAPSQGTCTSGVEATASTVGDEQGSSTTPVYRAVHFRGRGLLACTSPNRGDDAEESDSEDNLLNGRLLVKPKATKSRQSPGEGQEVRVVAGFDRITEWYHEHEPSPIVRAAAAETRANGAATRAREWCQIASALHGPVPVEQEESVH